MGGCSPAPTPIYWIGSVLTSGTFNSCPKLILKRIPMALKSLKTLLFTNAKEKMSMVKYLVPKSQN